MAPTPQNPVTTISITRKTKRQLDDFGSKNDSYDAIVTKLINRVQECDDCDECQGADPLESHE